MTEVKSLRILFMGLGNARVAWYRCMLPAMVLRETGAEADWCGYVGTPPTLQTISASVDGRTIAPDLSTYDIVVVQQPRGRGWVELIKRLQADGKKVLLEYDDFVHGISSVKDHDFKKYFEGEHLRDMELPMGVCDGMICSTEYIARRYSSHVPKTYVCKNGLDLGRYNLTLPERATVDGKPVVTIGWSGATGHTANVAKYMTATRRLMKRHSNLAFCTIGMNFADLLGEFGNRVLSIPFSQLETYPAAATNYDIALAPAGDGSWMKAKSCLRAYEAAALGQPCVADRHYEEAVEDGVTGFVVDNPGEVLQRLEWLIQDAEMRKAMGLAGKEKAAREFDIRHRVGQWQSTLLEAWDPDREMVWNV